MQFFKYHGCQNDFILLEEASPGALGMDERRAKALCHRHTGIGADGVAVVTAAGGEVTHPRMRIYNADGSIPEMCGNALRCVVKHLADGNRLERVRVSTDAGDLDSLCHRGDDGRIVEVTVEMGPPRAPVTPLTLTVQGQQRSGHQTSMGNPHFVTDSDDPLADATRYGPALATHPAFAEGCNISFVRWLDAHTARAVIYERGAGLTKACGTGACAVVTVGRATGRLDNGATAPPVRVQLPGGDLIIAVSDARGSLRMRGPAVFVYSGHIESSSID